MGDEVGNSSRNPDRRMDLNLYLGLPLRLSEPYLGSNLALNSLPVSVQYFSQKAMDLLLKLDFVQGGDPMIRDGKRSISKDLVKFLEFIDGISVKRQQISSKTTRNVRFQSRDQGGSQKVLDKLNQRIQGCYKVIIDDENDTEEEQEEEQGEIEDLHPIDDDLLSPLH